MDPVFLLDVKEWEKFIKPNNRHGKYIAVLSYERNEKIAEVLTEVKRKQDTRL